MGRNIIELYFYPQSATTNTLLQNIHFVIGMRFERGGHEVAGCIFCVEIMRGE